jgi:chromosomal replication initiator protein
MTSKADSHQAFFDAVEFTRSLSPATFNTWFACVQFDDLTDGVLSLRATNEFVQEWVETNFLPTLVQRLRALTGKSIQLAWILDPQLAHPISERESDRAAEAQRAAREESAHDQAPIAVEPASASVDFQRTRESNLPMRMSQQPPPSVRPAPRAAPLAASSHSVALSDLNPKQTFSSFVVGPSNQLAHAAAVAAAGGGGRRYNPLFICGGTGLGKTHLVHAIAHRMLSERPNARVVYVSAERFTNEFIHAIQHQRMDEFRARYRSQCDLLLVDDIQFLAGREQTQEEFFHTFNALHGQDRQIVVTSDKYPQNLERMEERLVSRFSWGLVADIQVPELETRVAIVRHKAGLEGIDLDDDVALYLAQVVRSNVRELEGVLIRLAAKSSLTSRRVDLAFAKAELSATTNTRPQLMSVDDVQRLVCHHFHIRSTDLTSKDRHKTVAFARHVAMYLCKQRLKCSFPELGRAFGGRDHTTVMSAVRKIEAQREIDPQVRAHIEALERKLAENS